jgi:tRNA threonylcarbamoyladenosine biosynthesis protein TsaB
MRVIAVDTAAPVLGVAAWSDGLSASRSARIVRGGEALIAPWITEVCAELGFVPGDLDGVVVSTGPGAFTGLRVGVAAASGLAVAVGAPVVAVGSLEARARAVGVGAPVLAWLDARKGRAYAAAFDAQGAAVHAAADVLPEVAIGWMAPGFVAVGEGALVWRDLVLAAGGSVADDADLPPVRSMAAWGAEQNAAGAHGDAGAVAPRYVRAPDAVPGKGRLR